MTKKSKQIYVNRLKSFAWRTAGLFIVTGGGFIMAAGSIYTVDWKLLSDVLSLTTLGAIVNEITKFMNTGV